MTVSKETCFSSKYFYQTITSNMSWYHCLIFPCVQPLCFPPVGTCTAPDWDPPYSDPPTLLFPLNEKLRSLSEIETKKKNNTSVFLNMYKVIYVHVIDFPEQKNPRHFMTTLFFSSRLKMEVIMRNSIQRKNMGALILHMK